MRLRQAGLHLQWGEKSRIGGRLCAVAPATPNPSYKVFIKIKFPHYGVGPASKRKRAGLRVATPIANGLIGLNGHRLQLLDLEIVNRVEYYY